MCPSLRMVSTIPSAVSGFTKRRCSLDRVRALGQRQAHPGEARQYSPYVAPPRNPTVRPSSASASADSPAATTTPAPSLPTAIAWPTRAARAGITGSGIGAVTVGSSSEPPATACERSAIASNNARSEDLTGAASTRTSTSRGPGRGVATVGIDSCRRPSCVTRLCSRRIVPGISDMSVPSLVCPGRSISPPGRSRGSGRASARPPRSVQPLRSA